MFLLLKYQKLLTFLVKNPKKKMVMFFLVLLYGITHLHDWLFQGAMIKTRAKTCLRDIYSNLKD